MRLALFFMIVSPAFCQEAIYSVYYEATGGAANVVTIQQPSSSPDRKANFFGDGLGFVAYCSAASGTVTFEHSGTAATSTAISPIGTSPGLGSSALLAFRSSNVGVGSVVSTYALQGGVPQAFSFRALIAKTNNANLTARVSCSATSRISAFWKEE